MELATGGGEGSCDRSRLLCLWGRDELATVADIGMVLSFDMLELELGLLGMLDLLGPATSL